MAGTGKDAGRGTVQLGLGCLHLVPREAARHDTPLRAWLDHLAVRLASVSGVSGVETLFLPASEGDDPAISAVAPWFAGGRAGTAGADEIEIRFRLTVDRALLAGLGPLYRGLGRWPREIRAAIVYEDDVPVLTAWSLEGADEATGTTAVDILRRHLERSLAGSDIAVDVLEPTPFPADIRIRPRDAGAAGDQLVGVTVRVQPGFDLIDVGLDTGEAAFEEAVEHVLYQARLEARDHYALILGLAETERLWHAVVDRFDVFVAGERGRRRPGGSSAQIRELMLAFVETKARILAIWHELAGRVEKARNADAGLLSTHILQRYERLPSFPFDEYMRMLDFLEGRRSQSSDARIAIISAVIGGLIGSLYVLFTGL